MENFIFSKGLKRPDTKSFKIAGLSITFFCIIYGSDYRTFMCRLKSTLVIGLKELSEFGCRCGWYFYRSRCNCSCFCTNHKYETDRTLRDRLDSGQVKGCHESSQLIKAVCLLSVMLENVHTRLSRDMI